MVESVFCIRSIKKKKIGLIEHLTEAFLSGLHFIANGCCPATSFPSRSHFCSFEVLEFGLREHPHQTYPPPPFQGLAQGSEVGGGLRGNLHCSSVLGQKKKKSLFPSLFSSPLALSRGPEGPALSSVAITVGSVPFTLLVPAGL